MRMSGAEHFILTLPRETLQFPTIISTSCGLK